MNQNKNHLLFFWVPLTILVLQFILEFTIQSYHLAQIHSENGPHELLQFFILVIALMVALLGTKKAHSQKNTPITLWFLLAAICCTYVAGEEVSWGQHFVNWTTPEYWASLNDQGETNFHNTSSWLDQKPRLILEIGVIVGGLLIPLITRFKPSLLPSKFAIIYPTSNLAFTALIFLGLKITDKADKFGLSPFERVSVVQELYLFYFVLLYLLDLRKRISLKQADA